MAGGDLYVNARAGTVILAILVLVTGAASQKAPDRAQQLYEEAKLEEQSGHVDQAIQNYLDIIKLNPGLAYAYNNLGRLYYQQGRLQEAIKPLKRASELN